MSDQLQRGIFAMLCLVGAIVIATGAWLEIARMRRGDSLLAARHFRLRLISACIWMLTLASLAGAVTVWWPQANATHNQRLEFVAVINGVVCLLGLALLLLGIDMWMLSAARRKVEREQAIRFSEQLHDLAVTETARVRAEQTQKPSVQGARLPKVRAYPAADASKNGSGKDTHNEAGNTLPGAIDSSEAEQ